MATPDLTTLSEAKLKALSEAELEALLSELLVPEGGAIWRPIAKSRTCSAPLRPERDANTWTPRSQNA